MWHFTNRCQSISFPSEFSAVVLSANKIYTGSPLMLPTQATSLSQSHNPSPSERRVAHIIYGAENQSSEAASIASIKILCCSDFSRYQGDFEFCSIMFSPYSAEIGIME